MLESERQWAVLLLPYCIPLEYRVFLATCIKSGAILKTTPGLLSEAKPAGKPVKISWSRMLFWTTFSSSRGWISAVRKKLSSAKKSRPIFSLRTSREKYPEGQETSQRGALSWTKDYPPPSMGYWNHYLHNYGGVIWDVSWGGGEWMFPCVTFFWRVSESFWVAESTALGL